MSGQQPVFDLGRIADIPARSDWDLEFTLYLPSARSVAVDYAAELAEDDVARFRMWDTDGETALVVATDQLASDGGTTVTIDAVGVIGTTPATVTVKLSSTDTDQDVGVYHVLLDVQDASDSDRWHPACRGTIGITSAPEA
jgi:hypothetical protein